VSLRVDYDERAISQAAEFLDDPQGIPAVLDAIDRMAGFVRGLGSCVSARCQRRPKPDSGTVLVIASVLAGEEDTAAELSGRPAFPGPASDRGADCRRKGPGNG
jgi:hypothetical protein